MASDDDEKKLDEFCKVLGEYYSFMKNDTYYQSHHEGKFRDVKQSVFIYKFVVYHSLFHIFMHQLVL